MRRIDRDGSVHAQGLGHSGRRLRRASGLLLRIGLAMSAATAWAGCKLKQMEMPVRIVDWRPIATLTLNGVAVPLLVDTGAFYSMLSASTAAQLKLPLRYLPFGFRIEGYTGDIAAEQARVEKVGLIGAELSKVDFIVGGNELGAGIMGVLGRNFLSVADTEYDLAHGVVRLSFPEGECAKTNFAHWAGEAPVIVVPLRRHNGRDTGISTNVSINGTQALALLDTGAPRTALSMATARRAGIKQQELTPNGRVGGAGEGRVKSWTGNVTTFEMGGEKITNNPLQIDETSSLDFDLLLGLDYFLSHRIYVSRLQGQLYATWNGGPVFSSDGATAGVYDPRYAASPGELASDDADGLARRGAAALAAGNLQRALEDLNRAVELAPEVPNYHELRARLHMATRDSRLALADLDEALRLDPTLTEARLRRAQLRMGHDDRSDAQADLDQLDAELPPSSHLRADMARLYQHLAQPSKALQQMDLWITAHLNDARLASVLNERCWLRARLHIDMPLALKDCEAAVDKDDGEAAFHDSLGWTFLRLGDAAKAKKSFDMAIRLEALPFSLFGRGLAQMKLKDGAAAERDWAAARKLNPSIDKDVRRAGFEFSEDTGELIDGRPDGSSNATAAAAPR